MLKTLLVSVVSAALLFAGPVIAEDNEGNAALGPAAAIPLPAHLTPEEQATLSQDWWRSGDDLRILNDIEGLIAVVTLELGCTRDTMDLMYATVADGPWTGIQASCNNDLNQSGLYVWLDEATGWMRLQ